MNSEEQIFKLILHSGNGRSFAMEAIGLAKTNNFEGAYEKIRLSGEELVQAHHIQTQLIQNEIRGDKVEMSLLMVHAQDHLMNALSIKDLSEEFVDMYQKVEESINRTQVL
ncbi:PTS lactose/cellobiose transporter subunit IIA [Peribacillus kribbensis]|uniref:PTS lactose/cellobiose transporter subunit IIA n=1 Tax=Peribacillus kribbensis TaxID=356658 RepID=UPI0004236E1D|nr:PTS lactose/cellobiose transporter subunit IIA [Peribacillus kribbensis]